MSDEPMDQPEAAMNQQQPASPVAIRSKAAPLYCGQKIFAALLCLVFGLWGAYDYAIKIPRQQQAYERFVAAAGVVKDLDDMQGRLRAIGQSLSPEDQQRYEAAAKEIIALSPGGAAPMQPSKFNRITQLFYIACLPFAPWFWMMYVKVKRQNYELGEDGSLRFTGDPQLHTGSWSKDDIADIDMSRWMAKSIAWAVHRDGTRLKLDAYLHKDLHLIIGAIASRLHPDQWDAQAKRVVAPQPTPAEPSVGVES